MKLLAYLTGLFVDIFGITHPEPGQERRVNLIIGGFLVAALTVAFGVVGFLVYMISR